MPNSSPPPAPPSTSTVSPSKQRLLTNQKPTKQSQNSAPIHSPLKDKITRDLPNFSDCHGCGLRIDYSNPNERLRLLDSFWRIVLLCKKCVKQVNSGHVCLYCFKDITANSASDCFNCRDCERLIHKDCVKKFGNSSPWSYSCSRELGLGLDLGFSVCIDCWVPELLKSSIRVGKKKKRNEDGDSGSLGKAQNGDRSLEEIVKDANCAVEKKAAAAVKAKEKALRKAVIAQNSVELASNAMELAVKKDSNDKSISEGLLRNSSHKGSGGDDVNSVVDDAELAFRLHRAMNSSSRISRNTCSVNSSCLDILKKMGSNGISPKWMDSGSHEDGKVWLCTNSKLNENQDGSISEASAHAESKESGCAIDPSRSKPALRTYSRNSLKRKECLENGEVADVTSVADFKPALKTYMRKNLKRKGCLENGEADDVVTSAVVKPLLRTYTRNNLKRKECVENGEVGDVTSIVDVVGTSTTNDDSKIVSESQFCLLDESKMELNVDDPSASSPDHSNGDIIQQEGSGDAGPEQQLLTYSKRTAGSSRGSQNDASSCLVAFQKGNLACAPRFAYCATEYSGLSDASLPSCVANLLGCASVVGSSQEGG